MCKEFPTFSFFIVFGKQHETINTMKKSSRPAPKTGIISRSGGKTSFRKLDPNEDKSGTKPARSTSARPSADAAKKSSPTSAKRRTTSRFEETPTKKASGKKFGNASTFSRKSSSDTPRENRDFEGKDANNKKFGSKKFDKKSAESTTFEGKKNFSSKPDKKGTFSRKSSSDKSRGSGEFEGKDAKNKKFSGKKFEDKKFEGKKSFEGKTSERTARTPFAEQKAGAQPPKGIKKGTNRSGKKHSTASSTTVLRLNKFLADAGVCSRRQADEYIEQGKVKVNGKLVTEHGTKVHLSDLVTVNGEPVNAEKHLTYVVLNKPKDYITTTSDEKGRKTVMELIPLKQRIYPIGRLDRHTTGVLLLTNDGDLAHRLMHPSYEVSRIYRAYLDKRFTQNDMRSLAKGVKVEDEDGNSYISGECNVAIDPEDPRAVTLELAEGKNREVRRIFAALGYEVERLDRKGYAGISTRGLGRGEYRHLTQMEVRALEQLVKLDRRLENATTAAKRRTKSRREPQTTKEKTS